MLLMKGKVAKIKGGGRGSYKDFLDGYELIRITEYKEDNDILALLSKIIIEKY